MRALVTGGAGFIGGHVVDALMAKGYRVRIFDNLELPTHAAGKPDYVPPAAEFILGDMRDRRALKDALKGVDVILHQAATGGFTPHLSNYMECNSLGTAHLLEVIRENRFPVQKIVVASSIAVYGEGKYVCSEHGAVCPGLRPVEQLKRGEWEPKCPRCRAPLAPAKTDEYKAVDPATAYAISKFDEERLVLNFGRQYSMPTVALRYFVTYGPRQSVHNPYTGVASIFSTRILNNLPMIIYEDGLQSRDFIYVGDVARANVFVLETERANGQVFNVGTGRGTTVRDLALCLAKLLKRDPEIEFSGNYRPGEVRHIVADPWRLEALGFRAGTTLEEGLSRYIDWLLKQGPLQEVFSRAEEELKQNGVVCAAPLARKTRMRLESL